MRSNDAGRAAIEARGVSKQFGSGADAVLALDDVSLAIRRNEFFTLLGPSGCGKTTLLRLIAGFEQPSRGDILLDGEIITGLPPFRRPVNTVFQSYALFPHMTVAQNIAFGLEMQRLGKAETTARVEEMLRLVKMTGLEQRRPSQLSGGQQQRVALARALANRPKVLLLDEPLSALDFKLRKDMQIELKRLQLETGITFIFVTHDQEEALTMSDRIAVMERGRILQVGSPTDIYEHPTRRFVADFIGDTNFLEARVVAADGAGPRVRLSSGAELPARGLNDATSGTAVTLAIRPERVSFAAPGAAVPLEGAVETVVYFGTDTLFHLRLPDGRPFVVRSQNKEGSRNTLTPGDRVGLVLPPDALQVLAD
jgi:spermidine/putrescine transport system ATP-binding protein